MIHFIRIIRILCDIFYLRFSNELFKVRKYSRILKRDLDTCLVHTRRISIVKLRANRLIKVKISEMKLSNLHY